MLFRYFFFTAAAAAAADRLFPLAGSFGTRRRVYTFRCGGRKLFGQRVIIAAAAVLAAHHSGGAAPCEKGFREKVYTVMWCRGAHLPGAVAAAVAGAVRLTFGMALVIACITRRCTFEGGASSSVLFEMHCILAVRRTATV